MDEKQWLCSCGATLPTNKAFVHRPYVTQCPRCRAVWEFYWAGTTRGEVPYMAIRLRWTGNLEVGHVRAEGQGDLDLQVPTVPA
jgi:hypothetical protein